MQRELRLSPALKHPKHFLNLREQCPSSTPDPHPGSGEKPSFPIPSSTCPGQGGWGGGQKLQGMQEMVRVQRNSEPQPDLTPCPNGRNKEEMGMLNREVKREKGTLHGELENLASGPKSATY